MKKPIIPLLQQNAEKRVRSRAFAAVSLIGIVGISTGTLPTHVEYVESVPVFLHDVTPATDMPVLL
jgi:hypothetical protein